MVWAKEFLISCTNLIQLIFLLSGQNSSRFSIFDKVLLKSVSLLSTVHSLPLDCELKDQRTQEVFQLKIYVLTFHHSGLIVNLS